jgi:hypothetical protein
MHLENMKKIEERTVNMSHLLNKQVLSQSLAPPPTKPKKEKSIIKFLEDQYFFTYKLFTSRS